VFVRATQPWRRTWRVVVTSWSVLTSPTEALWSFCRMEGALRGLLETTRIDGRRQIAVASHSIGTFFDISLQGAPPARLTSQAGFPKIDTFQLSAGHAQRECREQRERKEEPVAGGNTEVEMQNEGKGDGFGPQQD
jgi:hypothetical protein